MKQNAAPGARQGTTDALPENIHTASSEFARTYWSDLASKGLQMAENDQAAMQTNQAGLRQGQGRSP